MITKILYYTHYDLAIPDGPGTNEFEFTAGLAKHFGKNAWCVLPKPSQPIPHFDKINVIYHTAATLRTPLSFLMREWEIAREISNIYHEKNIDILTVRLPEFPLVPWFLAKRFHLPITIKTLGEWWHDGPVLSLKGKLLRPIVNATQRSVLKKAFAIDCGMEELIDQAIKAFGKPERFKLLPNAANTDRFTPECPSFTLPIKPNAEGPVLGFIGSMPYHRGALQMIQAAGRLKNEFPGISILVAGQDAHMETLMLEAKKVGLEAQTYLLGWIPYEQAPSVINAMDIGFSFYEHWLVDKVGNASQKVRQYLSSGKPVISIEQGHDFIENNNLGSTVDPNSPEEIDKAIRKWTKKIRLEKHTLQKHLRSYAIKHLSTEKLFSDRIAFWQERLER